MFVTAPSGPLSGADTDIIHPQFVINIFTRSWGSRLGSYLLCHVVIYSSCVEDLLEEKKKGCKRHAAT